LPKKQTKKRRSLFRLALVVLLILGHPQESQKSHKHHHVVDAVVKTLTGIMGR
jgi:hypothetical protein